MSRKVVRKGWLGKSSGFFSQSWKELYWILWSDGTLAAYSNGPEAALSERDLQYEYGVVDNSVNISSDNRVFTIKTGSGTTVRLRAPTPDEANEWKIALEGWTGFFAIAGAVMTEMGIVHDYAIVSKTIVIAAKFTPNSLQGHVLTMYISMNRGNCLTVLSKIFSQSAVDKRRVVLEAIHRANYGLRIGQFQMDHRDGEIMYQSEIPLPSNLTTSQAKELIRPIIAANIATHQRYFPAFRTILFEGKSAQEAIAQVEGTPIAPAAAAASSSASSPGNSLVCAKCKGSIYEHPPHTWTNWSCDHPNHQGKNRFTGTDPVWGCKTIMACNWGVCKACWDRHQDTTSPDGEDLLRQLFLQLLNAAAGEGRGAGGGETENPDETIAATLKACKSILRKQHYDVSFESSTRLICTVQYQEKPFIVTCDMQENKLLVRSAYYRKTPEAHRTELIEAITRANYNMRIGQFVLDHRDGEIMYKSDLPIVGSSFSSEQIEELTSPLIIRNISTHQKYLPAFAAILEKGKNAADAIAEVEGKADGNPLLQLLQLLAGEGKEKEAADSAPVNSEGAESAKLDVKKLTQVKRKLGQGGMGAAYHCIYAQNDVVAKEVLDNGNMKRFMDEINIQLKLHHPNLVGVIGVVNAKIQEDSSTHQLRVVEDPRKWMMITQYCANGTLTQWLARQKATGLGLDEYLSVRLMEEVALGMTILHDRGIVHMDLKPDNIFLNADNRAMVGDFGLATHVKRENGPLNLMSTMITKFEGGTLFYIDPDCFDKGVATRQSDVYAFGIILHNVFVTQSEDGAYDMVEILGPGLQFNRFHEIFRKKVTEGLRPKLTDMLHLSDRVRSEVTKLMKDCWDGNRNNRPKFEDIVVKLRTLREYLETEEGQNQSRRRSITSDKNNNNNNNNDAGSPNRGSANPPPPPPPAPTPPVRGSRIGDPPQQQTAPPPMPMGGAPSVAVYYEHTFSAEPFQLVPVVESIKSALGIEPNVRLNEALNVAAEMLGIELEINSLKTAKEKAIRIKQELGV